MQVPEGPALPSRNLRSCEDLPPAGYKVFEVRAWNRQFGSRCGDQLLAALLRTAVYRLKVEDRGAISSSSTRTQGNREFAGQANGRWRTQRSRT